MQGSNDNLLENFRESWKKELQSSSEAKDIDDGENPRSHVDKTNNRVDTEKADDEPARKQNNAKCESLEDEEFRSIYEPFSIVGNLLRDSNKCQQQDSPKHIDKSETYCRNVVKRRSNNSIESGFKKFKARDTKYIFKDRTHGEMPEESLLDRLIADIDEITDIPFFDMSLPREVAVKIFQHLGMKDLCKCAQVSKIWQSLAEDELLWCKICHKLGQETIYTTREKVNWKQIVRHNVERQRLLVSNWKGRVGQLTNLEHVKGKFLCSVHSCQNRVVAGFSTGEVKLWNLTTEDSCLFRPSDIALTIDEDNEHGGTEENMLHRVVTSAAVTAASYTKGNVDIWCHEPGSQPLQTYVPQGRQLQPPEVCLTKSGHSMTISYGPWIDVLYRSLDSSQFESIEKFDALSEVRHVKFYEDNTGQPSIVYSRKFSAYIFQPKCQDSSESFGHVTEIHDLIGAPISAVDFKTNQSLLGIGLESYGGLVDGFRIKLYDMKTGRLTNTLHGHTWVITCMNMCDSPVNELVTGSGDRKLRVFDVRSDSPVQTFTGHSGSVTCVQMDDWKIVSGAHNGFVCVWDRRMITKLWETHNRHPVRYVHYNDKTLIAGNIPMDKLSQEEELEFVTHRRYRGSVIVYDFLADLTTKDVPEICLSTYDQPEASRYNIGLAMPYDTLNY